MQLPPNWKQLKAKHMEEKRAEDEKRSRLLRERMERYEKEGRITIRFATQRHDKVGFAKCRKGR